MFQEMVDKDEKEKERRAALTEEERAQEDQLREEDITKRRADKEAAEAGDGKKKRKKKDVDEERDDRYDPLYERFWREFGKSIRMGVIEDSTNRARLTKLLRYPSSNSNGSLVGLSEYRDSMVDGQKGIFYLTGESVDKIKESPLLERALAENVEVLYMTDPIDEYVVQHITEFENNKLMDLAKAVKLRDETGREKKLDRARFEAWEEFLRWAKGTLGGKVDKVELSKRLTKTPCVVVAPEYGVTGRMAEIMRAQTMAEGGPGLHMRRILEINPRHSIIDELRRRWKENPQDPIAIDVLELLFEVASVQSGFEIEKMRDFGRRMFHLQKHDLNIGQLPDIIEEEAYPIDEEFLEDEAEEDEDPYDPTETDE
jgi:heat shock protein beta